MNDDGCNVDFACRSDDCCVDHYCSPNGFGKCATCKPNGANAEVTTIGGQVVNSSCCSGNVDGTTKKCIP